MLCQKIKELINTDEDEIHDFKLEWYTKNKKDEMLKDIFSFVNTANHKDCYIIFGVHDGDHKIVGIEHDPNRLDTEKLTKYLNDLPIESSLIPQIVVTTVKINNHLIDAIVVKDTIHVPVYLKKDYRPKSCNHVIHAGQIFCRVNNINTSIDKTANDSFVEKLWKKRFGLDLSIIDQYKVKLKDINNWEYFENDDVGFRYNIDPDYCMYLVDDDERRYRVESYSLSQLRTKMYWQILKLMYRDRLIKNILVVWLDGARFVTVAPELEALNVSSLDKTLSFQCFFTDTIDFYVENFLFKHKNYPTSSDYLQRSHLMRDIVVFKDKEQLQYVKELLKDKIQYIEEKVEPSVDQIKKYKGKMKWDFANSDYEYSDDKIKIMCKEKNVSEFINDFIDSEAGIKRPKLSFLE